MRIRIEVPDFQRSRSRNVNAYVKTLAIRSALRIALRDAETSLNVRRGALDGRQYAEAQRIVDAGPVVPQQKRVKQHGAAMAATGA